MSEVVKIEFPRKDVDAIFASMQQASKYLGYDSARAVASAAGFLVRSLGASTRVAPRFRDVALSADQPSRGKAGYKSYDVTGYMGKPRRMQTRSYRATSLRDAKNRFATIRSRGLAKATWSIALRSAGSSSSGMQSAAQNVARKAADFVETTKNLKGDNPSIEIRNRLPYVESALRGGPKDVSTAMARAAAAMQKMIEAQLVKRMGLGSLSR